MQFQRISLRENFDYICQIRMKLTALHNFEPTEAMITPWPDSIYTGLFVKGRMVGMADFVRYDEKFGGYVNNVFSDHFDLTTFCEPDRMGHIRSLYLEPDYQRRYKYFMFFYLSGIRAMNEYGCHYYTMTTTRQEYITSLYRKLGFRELCTMDRYPGQKPGHLVLLLGDIRATLENTALLGRWGI